MTASSLATKDVKKQVPLSTKDMILRMLALLTEEFNCNHQADLLDAESKTKRRLTQKS